MQMQDYEIFIVDDQETNIETLAAMLERGGFRVRWATNGQDAIEAITYTAPDLILMDILMPEMSGYEVCSTLKANPATASIPVIFLSALNDSKDRVRAFEVGGVDYIGKPYSMREVLARVATHLRLYQQQLKIQSLLDLDQRRIAALKQEIEGRWIAEEELQNALSRISRLNRLISTTNSLSELRDVMDVTCRELSNAYEHSDACITVFHHNEIFVVHQQGTTETVFETLPHVDLNTNPISLRAMRGQVFTLRGDLPQEIYNALTELTGNRAPQCCLVIPLMYAGSLLGIAFVDKPKTPMATGALSNSGTEIGQAMAQTLFNSLLYTETSTQKKALEQVVGERTAQLDRLNNRMAAILASVNDAIILLNLDGTINTTNRGFENLLGYLPDEQFGVHITQIGVKAAHHDIFEALDATIQHNRSPINEIVVRRKDGTSIDVDMSMTRIQGDSKFDDDYIVCVLHDISNLKETQRIKDNFISMVTHELRTPLTGINLMANALVNYYDRLDDEKRYDKLLKLKEQGQIMIELVESVLDISRLEARQMERETVDIDLTEIAEKIIEEQRITANQKNHELYLVRGCEEAILSGTPIDIQRIWRNLISNAIKYTPDGGSIEVRVTCIHVDEHQTQVSALLELTDQELPPGNYAIGQVSDNGHGLSVEDQEKLFTRFYRGWAAQSNLPGTGLGLALVKELLSAYNGGIDVRSKFNQGSTFTFWIPLEDVPRPQDHLHLERQTQSY
jgi:PAS domain S-box-containing protein